MLGLIGARVYQQQIKQINAGKGMRLLLLRGPCMLGAKVYQQKITQAQQVAVAIQVCLRCVESLPTSFYLWPCTRTKHRPHPPFPHPPTLQSSPTFPNHPDPCTQYNDPKPCDLTLIPYPCTLVPQMAAEVWRSSTATCR